MRTVSRTIKYSGRGDVFRIVPLGDFHLGNVACNEKLLQQTVDDVAADDHTYWIGMGDYADFIKRRDWRYDPEVIAPWLLGKADGAGEQVRRLKELLLPIKDKCLGLLKGNHEDDICMRWEQDVYASLIEILAPRGKQQRIALGYSGFILVRFQRWPAEKRGSTWTLPIFATHGWWGGRLYGNGALNLERVFGWVEAQIILAGHDHKRRAFPISRIRPQKSGGIEKIDGLCCSCGSFLDMAKYAEYKGYRPLPVGPLEILVQPDKHEVKVIQ